MDGRLGRWCREQLGSRPVEVLFRSAHLSAVTGVRLADGREVVVKVRPASPRLAGCVEVQRRLYDAGYPCPEPLTGVIPFGEGEDVATVEAYVGGGSAYPSEEQAPRLFAEAFARLIRLAPPPDEVGPLGPPPEWAAWDHDLQEQDEVMRQARDRLRTGQTEGGVIGHCDWLAGNLRWDGDELLAVHDWDSVVVESEDVLVGFAAALYPRAGGEGLATVDDTQRFLDAYGEARGRPLSDDEAERAWAAGVWTRAHDGSLTEEEARERVEAAYGRIRRPR